MIGEGTNIAQKGFVTGPTKQAGLADHPTLDRAARTSASPTEAICEEPAEIPEQAVLSSGAINLMNLPTKSDVIRPNISLPPPNVPLPPITCRRELVPAPAPLPGLGPSAVAGKPILQLGKLAAGCAGEATKIQTSLEIPVEFRIGARVRVESPGGAVQLVTYTGHGSKMNFEVRADSKRSGEFPFKIIVESKGRTWEAAGVAKVERPPPLVAGITTIMGGTKSEEIAFNDELLEDAVWGCWIDPPLPEFQTSLKRGTMKAGSRRLPFRVSFTPKDSKSQPVSTIVVIIGGKEYDYVVTGTVCGFRGRSWGNRAPGSVKPASAIDGGASPGGELNTNAVTTLLSVDEG
jgi:hypothetical protein